MRIRKVLRSKDGKIHLDNGSYYYTYIRMPKIRDLKGYKDNLIYRWVNSGDESNGLSKTMTLTEAIKEIMASPLERYYSLHWKEFRF